MEVGILYDPTLCLGSELGLSGVVRTRAAQISSALMAEEGLFQMPKRETLNPKP